MKTFFIVRKMALMLFTVVCVGSVFSSDASAVSTRSTSTLTIDPSMGYIVTGLGELKDQVAVVFTNSAAAATWQAPKNLKNVEFLAVGGGGGGGGAVNGGSNAKRQGGAGGGGGAVVTGFIKNLALDQIVNVTVGVGGSGGAATTSTKTGAGKGYNGGNSIIKIDDLTYITAYGGGGDGGYDSTGVANGGSNSGARGKQAAAALKTVTVVGSGVESLVTDVVSRANKGGGGYITSSGYPGAGGGGATSKGYASTESDYGGCGGFGYVSYITEERVVYGAGGGGGVGKNGGVGTKVDDENRSLIEGAGVATAKAKGSDGVANRGGGGGGGSYGKNGGAGGSGIVILRFGYSEVDIPVDVAVNITPKISHKVYTGEALVSGLVNTYAYTVEELGERINFGQQTVRVTLNDGYYWADGDTSRVKEFTWNITQEPNNWKVEPYLSHTSWPQIFASNPGFKFIAPETSFGILQSELSANGAAPQPFSGILPTEPGIYTLRYWVEGTANWATKEWKVDFTVYRSEDFAEGYKVFGLGEKGDEVAVVFTNSASWTVPANINGSAQFLVVGGGGGGGADCWDDVAQGGAGGGGGGVITGLVDFDKETIVSVTVGRGGTGGSVETKPGTSSNNYNYFGAAKDDASPSSFSVGRVNYVTANAGGRDLGSSSNGSTGGQVGGEGGSSAGSRPGVSTKGEANPGTVNSDVITVYTKMGNQGGAGNTGSDFWGFYSAAGGGGGATEPGGTPFDYTTGGKGGEGYASDITGALLVYGSGGGGGTISRSLGGKGGSGAGDGNVDYSFATSALPNQGGGGGGGGRGDIGMGVKTGGNGGSGIVVFRYRQFVDITALDEDLNRVYTGDIHTISNADTYIVSGTVSAINVGEYSITITPQGCFWPDSETDEARSYTWKIVQAINEWISDASITKTTWTIGIDEAGDITPPVAKFGGVRAMISKNGAEEVEFDGTIPNESGKYVVTYYPSESTTNFTSKEMTPQTLAFKVFSLDDIPEYDVHIVTNALEIGVNRKVVIPYEVTCEATSIKTLNLYVCYTIVGEGLTKTNLVTSIEGVKGSGDCEITDLKPGAEYQISFFGDIEGTIQSVEPIITTVVPSAATNLTVSSVTFVNDPMEFRITGSVVPGLGTTVVKVYWALNDASQLEVNAPKQFVYSIGDIITGESGKPNVEVEFGKPVGFTAVIPYTSLSDELIWKVKVENSLVTDTWGEQTFDGPVKQDEKVRRDADAITYTWTGDGTPDENGVYKWEDIRNWSPSVTDKECYGYPGTKSESSYSSKAKFNKDAKVDLNGAKMYINGAIQMSTNISVEVSNGTLGFQTGTVSLGNTNSILTLKGVKLPYSATEAAKQYIIKPADSSTVIIDRDNFTDIAYDHLKYSPTTTGKLVIKNYDGRTYKQADAPVKGSVVELSNTQWDIRTGEGDKRDGKADYGLPKKIILNDGDSRRAMVRSRYLYKKDKYEDDGYGAINLNGRVFDIKLAEKIAWAKKIDPDSEYHAANIQANKLTMNGNCTINIDVTDYKYAQPVKILYLYEGLGTNTLECALNVTAKGVDVTERVNARLYWDDDKKNLYFSQSPAGTRVIVR